MHKVSREIGLALDAAINEFTLKGVLDVPKNFVKWNNDCEILNTISMYDLAKYIIEGYNYPKTKDERLDLFFEWLSDYEVENPLLTRNSQYRKGRNATLNNIRAKMDELSIN